MGEALEATEAVEAAQFPSTKGSYQRGKGAEFSLIVQRGGNLEELWKFRRKEEEEEKVGWRGRKRVGEIE